MVSNINVLLAVAVATVLSPVPVTSEWCNADYDCYNHEYGACCNGHCQRMYDSCWCISNSDCPDGRPFCCDGRCSYDDCLGPGALAGIIIGCVFFIIIAKLIGLYICGVCCDAGPFRKRNRNPAVKTYGTRATTTVISTCAATNLSHPQYPPMGQPGQNPPKYQQQPGYYQGPSQYSQTSGNGYQSMPAYQPPPPYPGEQSQVATDYPQKGYQYESLPAVNPNI